LGNALKLNASLNGNAVKAIIGRYAVIKPNVVSGNASGYFVSIVNSFKYYKIDYTLLPKPGMQAATSVSINANDSLIVLTIPNELKKGSFWVEYAAYNRTGNISNPVRVEVQCEKPADAGSENEFSGTWKIVKQKQNDRSRGNYEIAIASTYQLFYCNNVLYKLVDPGSVYDNMTHVPVWASYFKAGSFTLGRAESRFSNQMITREFNQSASVCGNIHYQTIEIADNGFLGWSYEGNTRKLLMVFDNNGFPSAQIDYYQFDVIEKTSTKMVLYDDVQKIGFELQKN
jgi:hypothetical protein